ncbi:SDR family NAD(P)-dependent oxidoreductase [Saccharomonospora xinjiangensis]|uniref:SDR family NAD(P)-dependent oxidoreductase n=1 Tax=Saccharomonospora xinjiangensis TaxID=75294 RepID=UPI00107034F6|nr:SDR family NAD(P)-dependent oxidoreductase [Saccharomonospora xinjiangensis]QBQ62028.1 3-oxoacyl-[acyl-carrier-protein] reductase FabG [Saccharomonospora xinjiangensis]
MDMGLRGRVALVTGASTGIGAATARAFGAEGARVALTYRTNKDKATRVAEEVESAGGEALTVRLDLEDRAGIAAAVSEVVERWGGVDVLVANAVRWGGSDFSARFEDVPAEEWQAMVDANLLGTVEVVRQVLPSMRARRWGRIVLVSSGVAEEGLPGPGPYGTAKSGLHGMARALAWNAGSDGVLVNVVAPGLTLTERVPSLGSQYVDAFAAAVPSRRLSTPDDVARLVTFLGSEANGNLTGELVREGSSAARAPHVGG